MAARHAIRARRDARFLMVRRTVWRSLSWLVVLSVVACLAGVIAMILVPRVLGWQGVVVLSGSMEPTLQTGGIAFIEPATADEIAVGDVMTYRQATGRRTNLVTHRVVATYATEQGLEFRTKGDANTDVDLDAVPAARVVGKVRFHFPYVGRAVEGLRDRDNYYVFIGIPAALLILNEIVAVVTELRRQRSKSRLDGTAQPMSNAEGTPS